MDLKGLLDLICVKGTGAENYLVRIVAAGDGRILCECVVKDVPIDIAYRKWMAIEVTRMEYWKGESMLHLPIWNRPFRILVM